MKNKGLIVTVVAVCVVVLIAVIGLLFFRGDSESSAAFSRKERKERAVPKGGVRLTIQIPLADVLKSLSDNNPNAEFNAALQRAQYSNTPDFIEAFYTEYRQEESAPSLAAIFSSYKMRDKIEPTASDEEVLQVLREEVDNAIDNAINVWANRVDRYGVINPKFQRLEQNGCVQIDLPGVKGEEECARLRKLLCSQGKLEFWETYTYQELVDRLRLIDQEAMSADSIRLFDIINKDNYYYPLSPVIALAHERDTTTVNYILSRDYALRVLPMDVVFRWSAKPIIEVSDATLETAGEKYFELIALKADRAGCAALDGSVISEAKAEFDERCGYTIMITMNKTGAKAWAKVTRDNIGRAIAIVVDDEVYSYPIVTDEIKGGKSQISGVFTEEEAKDLAHILSSGMQPVSAWIVQEELLPE